MRRRAAWQSCSRVCANRVTSSMVRRSAPADSSGSLRRSPVRVPGLVWAGVGWRDRRSGRRCADRQALFAGALRIGRSWRPGSSAGSSSRPGVRYHHREQHHPRASRTASPCSPRTVLGLSSGSSCIAVRSSASGYLLGDCRPSVASRRTRSRHPHAADDPEVRPTRRERARADPGGRCRHAPRTVGTHAIWGTG